MAGKTLQGQKFSKQILSTRTIHNQKLVPREDNSSRFDVHNIRKQSITKLNNDKRTTQ